MQSAGFVQPEIFVWAARSCVESVAPNCTVQDLRETAFVKSTYGKKSVVWQRDTEKVYIALTVTYCISDMCTDQRRCTALWYLQNDGHIQRSMCNRVGPLHD